MADDTPSPLPASPMSPQSEFSTISSDPSDPSPAERSLARDVDFIKSLIQRSQAGTASRASSASITAQLFRRGPEPAQAPVSNARIFHELDRLRKRVKREVRQGKAALSENVDPDEESGESDGEADDIADEQEAELEKIRQEMEIVRQQREEWIEAAETRIDKLMNEKEGLAKALRDHQAQLRQIATGKEEVETSLRSAEQRTGTLDEQMREIHTALDVSKIELAELLAAHHEALTTL
ncbi:hypothetical protein LTR53_016596, partial [Teratosphaeriaceae sp. CCFEE 6253]